MRGVSLHPEEQALIERFEELTWTWLYRPGPAADAGKLPAAVWALEEMGKAGLEPGRRPLVDDAIYVEGAEERWGRCDKLWGSAFWSASYCAVSCGGAPMDIIKRYIQDQRRRGA